MLGLREDGRMRRKRKWVLSQPGCELLVRRPGTTPFPCLVLHFLISKNDEVGVVHLYDQFHLQNPLKSSLQMTDTESRKEGREGDVEGEERWNVDPP